MGEVARRRQTAGIEACSIDGQADRGGGRAGKAGRCEHRGGTGWHAVARARAQVHGWAGYVARRSRPLSLQDRRRTGAIAGGGLP
jgi:hypothetical protein